MKEVLKELENLVIEKTPKTPGIELNNATGDLTFTGRSIPENAAKVYEPVLNWVKEYVLNAQPVTNLKFNLEYFNTATSIWISKILSAIKRIKNQDYILFIHIYLPEEDFDEMNEFDDIKDAFMPIKDIFYDSTLCIGIKLCAINEKSEIVRDALVFI